MLTTLCGRGSWGGQCPRAMSVLSRLAGCCRPQKAVRSSSSSGMTPGWGSQRASFGLHARGNEECRADTIGLAPVGRPKSLVDMLLSPATPEPPGLRDARHRCSLPVVIELKRLPSAHDGEGVQ